MTGIDAIPNEILLKIFSYLSFDSMIQARIVCRSWHLLIPKAINSVYRILLTRYLANPCPKHLPKHCLVTLDQREHFVQHIESHFSIELPYLFRTILLEWPSAYPPPRCPWPDTLCWYSNKICIRCLPTNDRCDCYHPEFVLDNDITLTQTLFAAVVNQEPIPMADDNAFAWELFNNPPRLMGANREEQTRRMICLYADTKKQRSDSSIWISLYVKCLPLWTYKSENGEDEGWFCLILTGQARGEIHAWKAGWYDGWEANSLLTL